METFSAALQSGVEGNPANMLQLLRRTLRNPPESLTQAPDLIAAILRVTNEASPPSMPLRAIQESGTRSGERVARAVAGRRVSAPSVESQVPRAAVAPNLVADLPDSISVDRQVSPNRPILSDLGSAALDEIVVEHTDPFFAESGISPTRTLLLTGEPGTGKTMAARWLASALGRELYTVDLGSLMSHELGRSSINLQAAMRTAARHGAILFIDELDAVAKSRGDSSDVGEVRRLVNVFLLELDHWPDGQLLIGATNHPELLDRAVGRRFERRLSLSLPDAATRESIVSSHFPSWSKADRGVLAECTPSFSGSDLQTLALRATRRAAGRHEAPTLGDALVSLQGLPKLSKARRDRVIRALHASGLSDRSIASVVGVTHPTVGTVLRNAEHSK